MLALLMTLSLAIAYAAATTTIFGVVIAVGLGLPAMWWWKSRAVDISVDSRVLRVGRMQLERSLVTSVEVLSNEQFLHRIRSGASTRDVLSFTFTHSGGVVVNFDDSSDPFKAWVIGTRHPQRLADVLSAPDAAAI